jgi:hypothetical protein
LLHYELQDYYQHMLDPDAAPPAAEPAKARKPPAKINRDGLAPSSPEQDRSHKANGRGLDWAKGLKRPGRSKALGTIPPLREHGDRKLKTEDMPRVLEALRRTHGVKKPAARLLHVCPDTLYKYLAEHREAIEADLHQITENLVDDCESELIKGALKRGDFRHLQLILAVKGKDRGWNQRYEVTGANGAPLVSAVPSAGDLIQALEAVLAKRGEQAALGAPAGVPLLELSAEPAPAESGPGADPASDPTEDAG